MDSQPTLDLLPPEDDGNGLTLADYAQQAYLEYALSVVKGRALPDVCDGQKPVQRRILYSMSRMGLGFGGANGTVGAKPVKSARVVGDVLGRFHPHGDQAAYDALVRMAQDFSQRYPLVDGQGNFGSRDGDGAAAMRYTEARLARITSLLLDEIDEGTVNFLPNYDGSTESPACCRRACPSCCSMARAASPWAWPPRFPATTCARSPTPAWPSSSATASSATTSSSRSSPAPTTRAARRSSAARRHRRGLPHRPRLAQGARPLEDRGTGTRPVAAGGQELPPGVSTQKVLEEIEELTNPKVRAGKKALSAEQTQLKASVLAVLDVVRDESSKDAPVRLVFEPKTSRISQDEFTTTLLAHTSLESSAPINLTMVGIDGKPVQKSLRQMLLEWVAFREQTVQRRSQFRLDKVLDRIHILEGRQLVLLNIDEVIAIIRAAEDPKAALIARFNLSERQAEDILEIRLRQLARLEAIKIEQELKGLREDQKKLEDVLGSPATLRRLLIKEIETDAKTFEDARRTLIQAEKRAVVEVRVVDEPVTVIVSQKGWVRAQKGWAADRSAPAEYNFKSGDGLYGAFECRSVDTLLVFGSAKDKSVRVYTVPVAALPGARGDGQPVTTLMELESGTHVSHFFAGPAGASVLLANSGGYGFIATVENMMSRQRGGKAFIDVGEGEQLCRPSLVGGAGGAEPMPAATHVACASIGGRILTFEIGELKALPKGGRGLTLIDLDAKDSLAGAAAYTRSVKIEGIGRGAKEREETLEIRSLNNARAARGRKGKAADLGFKPSSIVRVL